MLNGEGLKSEIQYFFFKENYYSKVNLLNFYNADPQFINISQKYWRWLWDAFSWRRVANLKYWVKQSLSHSGACFCPHSNWIPRGFNCHGPNTTQWVPFMFWCVVCLLWGRVLSYSLGCLWTHYVVQASLELPLVILLSHLPAHCHCKHAPSCPELHILYFKKWLFLGWGCRQW